MAGEKMTRTIEIEIDEELYLEFHKASIGEFQGDMKRYIKRAWRKVNSD